MKSTLKADAPHLISDPNAEYTQWIADRQYAWVEYIMAHGPVEVDVGARTFRVSCTFRLDYVHGQSEPTFWVSELLKE